MPAFLKGMFQLIYDTLRSGAWLTPARLRVYPVLLGSGLAAALLALLATSHGVTDHWDRPLGTDFSGFWVAGRAVLDGHPAQPYDNALNAAAQDSAFGRSASFLPWPYPPYFLAVAALSALAPYLWSLALWQSATLALYLAATLRAGRPTGVGRLAQIGAALSFPAVAINLLHGQNGFLTAALLTFGALLLPKRPLMAGLLFGFLAYKPQFALALPVALLAGGFWRAAFGATVTVLIATAATVVAFGTEPWQAFFTSLAFMRHVVLEQGGPGFGKLQSVFAAVRLLGGSVFVAYGAQTITTMGTLLALAWLWRASVDHRLKTAGLMVASVLTTPYSMDYDLVVLAPAVAMMVCHGTREGFSPFGKTLLAWVWIMPLLARPLAIGVAVPLGWVSMGMLFWHIVESARGANRTLERGTNATASVAYGAASL